MSPAPDELDVQRIEFVGEQDGEVERTLKQKLAALFAESAEVRQAYLVRAVVDGQPTVILGLRAPGANEPRLAQEVGSVFATIFNSNAHLDVAFLWDTQLAQVSGVCRAFYDV